MATPTINNITCKRCGKETLNRTRRHTIAKALSFGLPIKKFKCAYCGRKTYLMGPFGKGQGHLRFS